MGILKFIKRHGMRNGMERWLRARGPVFDNYFEARKYRVCLKMGRPYFGHVLAASQGDPTRHHFMQKLVALECQDFGDKPYRILEVGSWAGGSAISWAEALNRHAGGNGSVVCVDPWISYFNLNVNTADVYKTMEKAFENDAIFHLFLHNVKTSGHSSIVRVIRGRFEELRDLLKPEAFDLAFVDGSHLYADALSDLKNAMPLVRDGGVLCGDDLEKQLHEIDAGKARLFTDRDYITDSRTNASFHPGVTIAVGELFGPVSSWHGFWAMRKRGQEWIQIDSPELDINSNIVIPEHLSVDDCY